MDAFDVARFWVKAKIGHGPDACWEWQAGRFPKGYGQFKVDGKGQYAHRIAWQLTRGPIPEGKNVCHRCDNPPCVNPDHLFVGTALDNVLDAERKGRREPIHAARRGERSNWAKLTEDNVREIRVLAQRGHRHQEIANRFNTSRANVCLIVNRKNWTHI